MSSPLKFQFDIGNLRTDLKKIYRIFKISDNNDIDNKFVIDYYSKSYLGYKLFHSLDDSIHMAVNKDGIYEKEGFNTQVSEIHEIIKNELGSNVLEMGCGRGFNLRYLASKSPSINFTGVDLTPLHVEIAQRNNEHLESVRIINMSFDDINKLNKEFQTIYNIESVCHSHDMKFTMKIIYDSLLPNGRYISFDGYLKDDFNTSPIELQKACKLIEFSMAIEIPWEIKKYLQLVEEIGFKVEVFEDYSRYILPNLLYFRKYSWSFFKRPMFAKVLKVLFPDILLRNSIAGYLLPYTIINNVQGYYKIILRK